MKNLKENSKTIFIVTQLDMLKAGNQILFRTIQGYLRKGYWVLLFTSNPESDPNRADYNGLLGEDAKNLIVYRFNPLFRFLWRLLKNILNKNRKLNVGKKERNNMQNMEDTVPFVDVSIKAGLIGFVSQVSFFLGGFLKLLKLTKIYRPVVIYGYEIYGAPLAWSIAKICHTPLVTRFQGTIAYPIIEKYKIGAWLRIPHHIIGLKTPSNLIIMDNDGTRGKEVLNKLKVPEDKIRFWINGVAKDIYIQDFDKKEFLNELGLNEDSKTILVACRLEEWKRVDRAIMAMPEVIKEVSNAILVIVGDGTARKRLERLVEDLKLNNNVLFIGSVPHEEVRKYFNACDIFLSLNDYSNLCNPVLEALECGKCIVTIDDGSTKEILINGQNAILIKKENLSNELPKTVVRLLTKDEVRQRLEKNARIFAEKHLLSWENHMELEISEVEKIL
jgi:glycosyltransferase involved in cell wall biosynthesis